MTSFATAFHEYQQERRHTTGIRTRKPAQEVRRRKSRSPGGADRRRSGEAGVSANRR